MRSKSLTESLRRNPASWVALGIRILSVLALAMLVIPILQRKATIDWLKDQGGDVRYGNGWLHTLTPPKFRPMVWNWWENTFDEWREPYYAVTFQSPPVFVIDDLHPGFYFITL